MSGKGRHCVICCRCGRTYLGVGCPEACGHDPKPCALCGEAILTLTRREIVRKAVIPVAG